jgi:hypothetical protein
VHNFKTFYVNEELVHNFKTCMACPASTGESKGKEFECKEFVINILPEVLESDHQWQESYTYRVSKKLRKVNEEAYTPKLVSIGPFHHDLEELSGVKLQKLIYLNKFRIRAGKSKNDLASIIERKKKKNRP